MDFDPEKVKDFLELFAVVEPKIASFPGCNHLELCQDPSLEHVYFTFSIWENESALESYRHSELFKSTWEKTKILFGGKPLAYSLVDPKSTS